MSQTIDLVIPDIGDFNEVEVVEVAITPGQAIAQEETLLTLESDKAAMEIPASHAGIVNEVLVKVGDKVAQGTKIAILSVVGIGEIPGEESESKTVVNAPSDSDLHAEVLVLGGGPGGYTAAFRAADLGKQVVIVEQYNRLGGVCLNVGCIPSKTLLHLSHILSETREMGELGIDFAEPAIDLNKIRAHKESVVKKLTSGLAGLARQRKVKIVQGKGEFLSANQLQVETKEGSQVISFDHAIVAAGSRPTQIPNFPHDDPRVWDSTDALNIKEIPKRLLVIGGGIIGLEMATIYHALGAKITVVELTDTIFPGCDKDLSRPLLRRIQKQYEKIFLSTKVTGLEAKEDGIHAMLEGAKAPEKDVFDAVLVAVGRRPNGYMIGAVNTGLQVDERGFIPVDRQQRTNVPHIFAIGDIVGDPMLAHKATHEGRVAAEVIAGLKSQFDPLTIPSVAYTDPEVAWMGITEEEAKRDGIEYVKGAFPWAASGRSLSLGRDEGLTKALFSRETGRIIGAGMTGPNAGELIAEAVLALEMGADAEDIGLTIHPHPTLSESFGCAAEVAAGSCTDIYAPKKK